MLFCSFSKEQKFESLFFAFLEKSKSFLVALLKRAKERKSERAKEQKSKRAKEQKSERAMPNPGILTVFKTLRQL